MKLIIYMIFVLILINTTCYVTGVVLNPACQLIIFKGAHAPVGEDGATNQYYLWSYSYGSAGTCKNPQVFDIRTGKLLLDSKYTWTNFYVEGKYIILNHPDVSDSNPLKDRTCVYNGSKLVLSIKANLLFVDSIMWHCKYTNEVVSYSMKTNKPVRRIPISQNESIYDHKALSPGRVLVLNENNNTSKVIDLTIGKTILKLPFYVGYHPKRIIRKISKGILYEVDFEACHITRMIKTPCSDILEVLTVDRVIDNDKSILYDVITGQKLSYLNDLRNGVVINKMLVFNTGYDGKMLFGYSLNTGKLVWKYETAGYFEIFTYDNKLFCIELKTNYTICIDGENGKQLWKSMKYRFDYYNLFVNGDLGYETVHFRDQPNSPTYFACVDLYTGKEISSVDLHGETIAHIDFTNNLYYIHEYGDRPKAYDLASHKRIW